MSALPQPAEPDAGFPVELRPSVATLWQRYHSTGPGDASEEELVLKYLPLVKSVVGRLALHLPARADVRELESAGMVGLLNALRNFDAQIGTPFEAYARLRIRGAVLDELRRLDWVPRSIHVKARRVQEAMEQLEQQLGRMADDSEVAGHLGLSLDEYCELLDEVRPVTFVCLDAVVFDENAEEISPHECITDTCQEDAAGAAARADLAELIFDRLQELPELHRKIVALYYLEGLRVREIAAACGFSESRISQIHTQAIFSLRSHIELCEKRVRKY